MGRFLTLSAFVFLALVVIAATIPSFIDWQAYREPVERAASDGLGREVKISGKVGFAILPYPSVELGGVSVAGRNGDASDHLLKLETLSAKLALAPLLRGAVQIETFEIEGADLRLKRSESGSNWSFTQEDANGQTTDSIGGVEGLLIKAIRDISIDDFSAKDLRVSYKDVISGQTFEWEIQHGSATLASMNGPFEGEGRVIVGGEAFYVTAKVGAARPDRPRPVILDGLTAEGLSLKFDGAAGRQDGETAVQGRLAIETTRAQQLGIPFAALTGTGRNAWVGTTSLDLPAKMTGQVTIAQGILKGSELEIKVGTASGLGEANISLATPVSGDIRIQTKSLDLDEMASALSKAAVTGPGDGESVDVTISVEAGSAKLRGTRIDDVDFAVSLLGSGPMISSFHGILPGNTRTVYALKDGASGRGRLTLETADARAFLDWAGVDLDGARARAFRTLNVAGDVIITGSELKLTGMSAALDGVKVEGALVRTRTERPSFGANLKILGLDLERFGTGSDVETWLEYMSRFDMNAIIKLRQFTGFDLKRRSVDLKAQMVRGKFNLEDLQVYGKPSIRLRGKLARDSNGALGGNMRLDATDLALCEYLDEGSGLEMPGCDSNPAFKASGKFDVVAGKATGQVTASAANLGYEGTLQGVETLFGDQIALAFDGKGDVEKLIYTISGKASGNDDGMRVEASLKTETAGPGELLGTFKGTERWSEMLLGVTQTHAPVTLETEFVLSSQQAAKSSFELKSLAVAMGPSALTGQGTVKIGKDGQDIDLKLEGQNLSLLKPHGTNKWSTGTIGFALPDRVNGKIDLGLTNTVLAGIPVTSSALTAEFKSDALSLDISEATAFGGKWDGDVTLRKGKGGLMVSVEGKAREINIEDFVSASLGSSAVTGNADLSFNVTSDGRSFKSLAEHSAGMVSVSVLDGRIKGFDAQGFSAGLKDAAGELGARLVVEEALASGSTPFTRLESEMTLADGKLRTISMEGALKGAILSGDGEIDLGDLTIEGRAVLDLDEHKNLPVIRGQIGGDLAKPRTSWDAEELVLKFTEAWLLSNRETVTPDLPGAQDSGVVSEELDDLAEPVQQ